VKRIPAFDPVREAPLLSAYVDGELEPTDAARVEAYLADSPAGRAEVRRLRELRALTDDLRLRPAPPEAWEAFWEGHYNRVERSLGWVLFGIGAVVVASWGVYRAALAIIGSPALPWWLRLAICAGSVGIVILLVSAVRERLYARRRTRYRDVVR
jgi:anti-sigma factor RsiW